MAEKIIALVTNGCRFAGPAALLGLKHLNCRIYVHDQSFSDDAQLDAFASAHNGVIPLAGSRLTVANEITRVFRKTTIVKCWSPLLSFHQTISQEQLIIMGIVQFNMERSTMTRSYDLVVLGAGPAGESAAELAAFLGHSVVIVEKNKPGGVVTTTGGAPTKTLRESTLALTGFYNREVYGITVSAPPQLVVEKIAERTTRVSKLLQDVTAQNIARNGVEYLQGTAKVCSDRRALVSSPGGC
jgi:hypothetical protein